MEQRLIDFSKKYNFFARNNMISQIKLAKKRYNITDNEFNVLKQRKILTNVEPEQIVVKQQKIYKKSHPHKSWFDFDDIKFDPAANRGMFNVDQLFENSRLFNKIDNLGVAPENKKKHFFDQIGKNDDKCINRRKFIDGEILSLGESEEQFNRYESFPCITNRQYNIPPKIQYKQLIHYNQDASTICGQQRMIDSVIGSIVDRTKNNGSIMDNSKEIVDSNPYEHYFNYIDDDIQTADHVVLPMPVGGHDSRQFNHVNVRSEFERDIY